MDSPTRLRGRSRVMRAALAPGRQRPQAANTGTRTGTMSDAEAAEVLQKLHAGDLRSSFAQALFPYNAAKYRSRGEWAKTVGKRVAKDIRTTPQLRLRMEALGYKPGQKGYSLKERIELVKFYGPTPASPKGEELHNSKR